MVGLFIGWDIEGSRQNLLCAGIEEVPTRGDFLACEIEISQRGDAVWPGL